jgi:hypothetical protein
MKFFTSSKVEKEIMSYLLFLYCWINSQEREYKKKNLVHNKAENDYLSMSFTLVLFLLLYVDICLRMPVNISVYFPPFFSSSWFLLFFLIVCSHTSQFLTERKKKRCILIDPLITKTVHYYHRFNCTDRWY